MYWFIMGVITVENTKWEAPLVVWSKAWAQWLVVGSVAFLLYLLTFFPMAPLVILTAKYGKNIHGEDVVVHEKRYILEGSSGVWKFLGSDVPIIKWWSNLEDGILGEPSGKHSASVKGKEDTFLSKYLWLTRNPFNYIKRTTRFFACFVNDCNLTYWGDKEVSDKTRDKIGSYLIMAVDKNTNKVYYGYRKVMVYDNLTWYKWLKLIIAKTPFIKKYAPFFDNRIYQATFGYKIKPTHIGSIQDSDDLDKAFTFRVQIWGNIN